jgi:hypothetical protein
LDVSREKKVIDEFFRERKIMNVGFWREKIMFVCDF